MTAMIRWAEAPCAASIITRSSMSASFGVMPWAALAAVDWTMKTSAPRIDSLAAVDLAVGERPQVDVAHVHAEVPGDAGRELHRAAAAEDHEPLGVVLRDRADEA